MNGLSDLWSFKSKARKGFHATTLPGAQKRLPGRLGTYWGAGGGACGHGDVALGYYLLLYHLLHLEVLLFLLK